MHVVNNIWQISLVAIFILLPISLLAQEKRDSLEIVTIVQPYAIPDSSQITARLPDEASLAKFKNDTDFRYTEDFEYSKTILGYIKYYISKLFSKLRISPLSFKVITIIFWVFLVVVTVFITLKMLGVDTTGIFFKRPPMLDLSGTVFDENMHQTQYLEMLQKALDTQQYRLAVRIIYLIALKKLVDNGQIEWQADKTNRMYLKEIRHKDLCEPFTKLTRLYECIWYGDFDIEKEDYQQIEQDFEALSKLLP